MTNPKTTLISYTGIGRPDEARYAMDLLTFTKATRLELSPQLLASIQTRAYEDVAAEMVAMAKTIRSSWEFVDVTFLIEGVTRATAQQMTRTRHASFAMQSMRVTDVRDIGIKVPVNLGGNALRVFQMAADFSMDAYQDMVDRGVPLEDARGILPLNTKCNLVAKYNLRAFAEVASARKSLRAQGEYSAIVAAMQAAVVGAWPWALSFFESEHELAISMLEAIAKSLPQTTGSGPAWEIAKAVDLLRKAQ